MTNKAVKLMLILAFAAFQVIMESNYVTMGQVTWQMIKRG